MASDLNACNALIAFEYDESAKEFETTFLITFSISLKTSISHIKRAGRTQFPRIFLIVNHLFEISCGIIQANLYFHFLTFRWRRFRILGGCLPTKEESFNIKPGNRFNFVDLLPFGKYSRRDYSQTRAGREIKPFLTLNASSNFFWTFSDPFTNSVGGWEYFVRTSIGGGSGLFGCTARYPMT